MRAQNHDMIFLCETKLEETKLIPLLKLFNFPNIKILEPVGLSCGLVLMWKNG